MIPAERSYKDVDKFRKICRDDLDKAMSVALIYNIGDVCKKCGHLPRYTFEAYNYYLKYNKNKGELMTDREELEIAVKALDSKKAKNITALKVDDLTILANYFVIASASSTTQVKGAG